MSHLFNYQTIDVDLERSTRTLKINLKDEFFNWEFLFELESILAWCTNKVEIKSILISSENELFSYGHKKEILQKMKADRLQKFSKKLQKINYALHCLPQTIICDLGNGAENIAVEFALSCDIRIAHQSASIKFNHTSLGLVPCSGGISTLGQIVGHANAKNWLLSGLAINNEKLLSTGFIFDTYTNNDTRDLLTETLLSSISSQSDVNRIQTKLGLTEAYRERIEELGVFATKLSNGAMVSEDWKNTQNKESMPAKHFGTAVKLSLVKNQPEEV